MGTIPFPSGPLLLVNVTSFKLLKLLKTASHITKIRQKPFEIPDLIRMNAAVLDDLTASQNEHLDI